MGPVDEPMSGTQCVTSEMKASDYWCPSLSWELIGLGDNKKHLSRNTHWTQRHLQEQFCYTFFFGSIPTPSKSSGLDQATLYACINLSALSLKHASASRTGT